MILIFCGYVISVDVFVSSYAIKELLIRIAGKEITTLIIIQELIVIRKIFDILSNN